MGIISWQGPYSGAASSDKHPLPPTNTSNLPFWVMIVYRARIGDGSGSWLKRPTPGWLYGADVGHSQVNACHMARY